MTVTLMMVECWHMGHTYRCQIWGRGGGRQDHSKTFTQKQSKQDRDNREDVWEKLEKSKLDSDSSGDADMLKVNLAKDGQD